MGKKHDQLKKKIDFYAELVTIVAVIYIAGFLFNQLIKTI